MLKICVLLILSASVWSESQVRETETWMPMKSTNVAALPTHGDDADASGDSMNGADFGFTDEEDNDYSDYSEPLYDDEDEYEEFSGSGDQAATVSPGRKSRPSVDPDLNKIPEPALPPRPTDNDAEVIRESNEIPPVQHGPNVNEENLSNVLMSHTSDDSIFNKKEVLAALIAGGAVGLLFAILPIALLIYCMKKKDEGSYDLGKKPIYKKAPTTEIFA